MNKNLSFVSELLISGLFFIFYILYLNGDIKLQVLNHEEDQFKFINTFSSIALLVAAYIIGIIFNTLSELIVRIFHLKDKIDRVWKNKNTSPNFLIDNAKYSMLHSGNEGFAESLAYHERLERLMRTLSLEAFVLVILLYFAQDKEHYIIHLIILFIIIFSSSYGYIKRRHWIANFIYGAWLNYLTYHNHIPSKKAETFEEEKGTILMLTGGTASRTINIELIKRGYSIIRVLSAFDSGGSSKILRDRFTMPAIGDLRNALMQIASSSNSHSDIIHLFNYRINRHKEERSKTDLQEEFLKFIESDKEREHPLIRDLEFSNKIMCKTYLTSFWNQIKAYKNNTSTMYDFNNGSIGNFILVGIYIACDRDINTAMHIFCNMWGITKHKVLLNTVEGEFNIRATYHDGTKIDNQDNVTDLDDEKDNYLENKAKYEKIKEIELFSDSSVGKDSPKINNLLQEELKIQSSANRNFYRFRAVIYGPGSFFTSTLQHFYVEQMIQTLQGVQSHTKILIVGFKKDKENHGYTQADLIEYFCEIIEKKIGTNELKSIITHAIVHQAKTKNDKYMEVGDNIDAVIKKFKIEVIYLDMENQWELEHFDSISICDEIEKCINTSLSQENEKSVDKI